MYSLAIAAQLLTLTSARYSKFTISPFVSLHCTGLQSGKDFAIKEGKCHDVDIESFYMSIYKHKGCGKWQNPDQNCTLMAYDSRECVEALKGLHFTRTLQVAWEKLAMIRS